MVVLAKLSCRALSEIMMCGRKVVFGWKIRKKKKIECSISRNLIDRICNPVNLDFMLFEWVYLKINKFEYCISYNDNGNCDNNDLVMMVVWCNVARGSKGNGDCN